MLENKDGVEEKEIIAPESQDEELKENDDLSAPDSEDVDVNEVDEEEEEADEVEDEEPEEEIDYKAELEKSQKISDNYKQGMLNAKDKLKKKDKKVDDEDDDFFDDEENEDDKVNKIVTERVNEIKSELLEDTIEDLLDTMTDNPDERKLIKYHYDNTLNKTGFSKRRIQEDLGNAKALANQKRVVKENKELKLAIKTKNSIKNSGAGGSIKSPDTKKVKLNAGEKVLFERVNKRRVGDGKKPYTPEEFKSN